jgi:integrase
MAKAGGWAPIIPQYVGHTIYCSGKKYRVYLDNHWVPMDSLEELKKFINDHELKRAQERKDKHGNLFVPVAIAVEDYFKHDAEKFPDRSQKAERTYSKHFRNHFGDGRKLNTITYQDMDDFFFKAEKMKDYAASSKLQVKIWLGKLKTFCENKNYYTNWNYFHKIKLVGAKKHDNAAKRFTYDDLVKFLDAVDKSSKWYTIWRLFAAYGFRPVELRKLERSHWVSAERTFKITKSKTYKEDRQITIVRELAAEIDELLTSHNRNEIFINGCNYHLGINAIYHEFQTTAAKAGLEKTEYSPYSFRKFAARNLYLKLNKDLPEVERILGHSREMWDTYQKLSHDEDGQRIWWDFPSEKSDVKPEMPKRATVDVVDKIRLLEQLKALPKEERIKMLAEIIG